MDPTTARRRLQQFNERVERLKTKTFFAFVQSGARQTTTLSYEEGRPLSVSHEGPEAESLEALLLTLRFFVQDNEITSLRKMAEIYESDLSDESLRRRFQSARTAISTLFDTSTNVSIGGAEITLGDVFQTFLYGEYAHAEPQKQRTLAEWKETPFVFAFLWGQFVHVVALLVRTVEYVSLLNDELGDRLASATTEGADPRN